MGLRDVNIPRASIPVGDTTLELRGLTFSDIMQLANVYGPQMVILFQKVQSGQSLKTSDVRLAIGSLAQEFPDMAAACIALATDDFDEETVKIAKGLTFPVQTQCIEAIFHKTFASEADVKKLIESVTRMIVGVSGALEGITLPSLSGIGESAAA